MAEIQLGVIEARFADMIWEHEPVTSSELVKLAAEAFTWKRTTTHTVLKRLCSKGLFENQKGTVTSLISRGLYCRLYQEQHLDLGGSGQDQRNDRQSRGGLGAGFTQR